MFTNVTLLYILLLIPLSGFIAWLGDRIGHKSGKRRHTLFGLRPRHTAMVFTIGTGMCISLVSFGLMWLGSESFRIVVRDGVRLYEANREYKQENILLNTSNHRLEKEVTRRKDEAKTADDVRNKAVIEKERALTERAAAVAQEREAQARARQAVLLVEQEKGRLVAAQMDLARKQRALTNVQGTLKFRSVQLKQAESLVAAAKLQVASATARFETATAKAGEAELKLADVRKAAQAALDEQSLALAGLHKQLDDQKAQFADQKALFADQETKIDAQRKALADLDGQVESGRRELALIRTNTQALREQEITYQVGDEVDRIEIKPGYNVWRIEAILQSFMTTAGKKAEQLGAIRDKTSGRAIVILPRRVSASDLVEPSSSAKAPDEIRVLTEDDSIRYMAESIRRENADVCVRVLASANVVRGEPVAVNLTSNHNPVVFNADAQIADAHVDGNGSRQQVADAVFSFMRQNVKATLLKAGIIPRSRRSDDASGTVINLSGDTWINIMDRVREAGSRARIVVTANREIRAGDSLDDALNIDVKGVQSTAFRNPN